ncbi:MAG TPA: protein kinase [Gemmatimonadales bacterium]
MPAGFTDALRDRYTFERELGQGGMATVYLAQDLKHKRPVALKLLRAEYAQALGPARFRREIETAARLQHPHICAVYDSGEVAGHLWFTMPYVRGQSLRELLQQHGRLPVDQVLRIVREAAQGLQYAHEEGVVHRDIKPENILLSRDGVTLLADFGIARPLDSSEDHHLTRGGVAVGTPAYMAPEQAMGETSVDGRADQYSLAVTCYEMLAGAPPFVAATAAAVFATRLRDPTPSARTSRPEVSPAVDQALQRALSVEPADRFETIAEFARSLESPTTVSAPIPESTPSRRRIGLVLVLLALLVLLGAGSFLARWQSPAPVTVAKSATPKVLAVLPFENLGDSSDRYFADGVTDEVRTKLAQVGGLEVIARSSSVEYRETAKRPQDIARELGADYLLTGTVRWEKRPGKASRVRVIPELVEVRMGSAPRTRWGQQFDAALTDVFAVQADIAGKVANALDLALGAGTRERFAAKPTQDLDAYTAYLRGKELRAGERSPEAQRAAIIELQRAVTLDSTFAAAWAELAMTQLAAFRMGGSQSADADAAGESVQRAKALAPDLPDTRAATGSYQLIARGNPEAALAEYAAGLKIAPGRGDLLDFQAEAHLELGRWKEAIADLEHAARLDPRSPNVLGSLGDVYARARRYPEARNAIARARALRPSSMSLAYTRARIAAAEGDLNGVHQILGSMEDVLGRRAVVAFAALREDLIWTLDEERLRMLLQLTPADLDGGRADWSLAVAETHWLRGDQALARAYGDTAVAEYARLLAGWGTRYGRAQLIALKGMALGYAGRPAEGIVECRRALQLEPLSTGRSAPYIAYLLARNLVLAGDPERAVDQLEAILQVPDYVSSGWLRIDRTLERLRGNARFRQLSGSER